MDYADDRLMDVMTTVNQFLAVFVVGKEKQVITFCFLVDPNLLSKLLYLTTNRRPIQT